MSRVMNVILTHGCGEYDELRIAEVNSALVDSHVPFARIPASYSASVGGEKNMECTVYLAAFNYMPLDRLVAAIRAAKWRDPDDVQLFVKDEDEQRFTEREWREHA
jgi:hypothetical protein